MPDCKFVRINPLYAVNTLAHLEASPGIRIGRGGQPCFRHFQPRSFSSKCGRPFFHAPDVVFFRIGIKRLAQLHVRLVLLPKYGGHFCGIVIIELRFAVGRLHSLFRKAFIRSGNESLAAQTILFVLDFGTVRTRFFRQNPVGGIFIRSRAGHAGTVAFRSAHQQIALRGGFVALHQAGNSHSFFPHPHFRQQVPFLFGDLRARPDRMNGGVSRALAQAPYLSILPPGCDKIIPSGRSFRHARLVPFFIAGKNKALERLSRHGIKPRRLILGPHLGRKVQGQRIARFRHVLHAGKAV